MEEYKNWSSKDKSVEEIMLLFGKRKEKLLAKDSKAESHFEMLLKQQQYFYIREKAFMADGFLCYVDFYIPRFKLAIEIDGKEHKSQKGKYRDALKTKFLSDERNVYTYRITNEDCLSMNSIDILSIVRGNDAHYKQILKKDSLIKSYWFDLMQPKCDVDLRSKIYAYSKINDVFYKFDNVYELSQSVGMKNKDIFKNLNNQVDFMQSVNFIFAVDLDTLNNRVDKFKARV